MMMIFSMLRERLLHSIRQDHLVIYYSIIFHFFDSGVVYYHHLLFVRTVDTAFLRVSASQPIMTTTKVLADEWLAGPLV
jgi:hypothetical protein